MFFRERAVLIAYEAHKNSDSQVDNVTHLVIPEYQDIMFSFHNKMFPIVLLFDVSSSPWDASLNT